MSLSDSQVRALKAGEKRQKQRCGSSSGLYVIVEPISKGGGKSFIDTPDGINHDPGLYFDEKVDDIIWGEDRDGDGWDDLVAATFDALRVLHIQHPYRRLDRTFYLKEDVINFFSSFSCY